jgi:hypothetical protein
MMPVPRPTGLPQADATTDFLRARRRRQLARLVARLRREPGDVTTILPYEEVVEALGFLGERALGLRSIPLHSIVGTVDRTRDFDRRFRPTSGRVRSRWERIATAMRRGEAMPPISVYRIGELHFVRDGHHRVSVARALGHETIDAWVTEVRTRVGADRAITRHDLPVKSHERLFFERVPLPPEARGEIRLSEAFDYGDLAEAIEAWGFRVMQERGELLDRAEAAETWLQEEYRPVVSMLREADLIGRRTETEAYMRVACDRYRLLRTHEWSEEILARLRDAM